MFILLDDVVSTTPSPWPSIIMIGGMLVLMYFLMIRPQKKEQKKRAQMFADMQVGDTVMTTGGFYGTLLDIQEDTVVVEFGNNKNCRIPMQRNAIAAVEKTQDAQ